MADDTSARKTSVLGGVKRGTEFDGPGAQAAEPLMTPKLPNTEVYYNHTARTVHFVDGSFMSPGFGLPMSEKALEHPGVKRLVEAGEISTKKPTDVKAEDVGPNVTRLVSDTGDADRPSPKFLTDKQHAENEKTNNGGT